MSARLSLGSSSVALALALAGGAGCQPKGDKVPVVSDDANAPGGGPDRAPAAEPRPVAPVEKIRLRASIKELGDMLDAFDRFAAGFNPGAPMNSRAELQGMLLGTGFGPGAFESLDLDGLFAFELAWPREDQASSPADDEMWGQIPTTDNRRLIDAMPSAYAPQPFGEGRWQVTDGDLRVMLAESPGALRFALAPEHLDRVGELAADQQSGRRIRVKVWDIPADDLDAAELLGLGDGPLARRLGEVIAETDAIEGELDFGTDRDVLLLGAVQAPFGKLGLGPIGKPRAEASAISNNLPDNAAMAFTMAWGNPALLHKTLDRLVPLDQIPAPFDAPAREAVRQTHKLLDRVQDEIILGVYMVPKGGLAVVLGGAVRKDDRARLEIRAVLQSAADLLGSFAAVTAQDPKQRFKVTFKPDGASFGGVKADRLTITVPESIMDEFAFAAAIFGTKKPKLDVYALTVDNQAYVAFGVGAKRLLSDVARSRGKRKTSLESDGGLAAARAADGGCQVCMVMDPKESLLALLELGEAAEEDKAELAEIREHQKTLTGMKLDGALSLSVHVGDDRGSLALGLPKTLLFADPAELEKLSSIVRDLDL